MFDISTKNLIVSDEGFSVRVKGPTEVVYSEGTQNLSISSELLAGPAGLILYSSSIKQWEGGLEISQEKKEAIVNNIRAAFKFKGFEIQVI